MKLIFQSVCMAKIKRIYIAGIKQPSSRFLRLFMCTLFVLGISISFLNALIYFTSCMINCIHCIKTNYNGTSFYCYIFFALISFRTFYDKISPKDLHNCCFHVNKCSIECIVLYKAISACYNIDFE